LFFSLDKLTRKIELIVENVMASGVVLKGRTIPIVTAPSYLTNAKPSAVLQDEVLELVRGLGTWKDVGVGSGETRRTYIRGEVAEECLTTLRRLLQRERTTEARPIFRQLCEWNVLASDLLPLMMQYHQDSELVQLTREYSSFSFSFSSLSFVPFLLSDSFLSSSSTFSSSLLLPSSPSSF
jgi:hypothetical protein